MATQVVSKVLKGLRKLDKEKADQFIIDIAAKGGKQITSKQIDKFLNILAYGPFWKQGAAMEAYIVNTANRVGLLPVGNLQHSLVKAGEIIGATAGAAKPVLKKIREEIATAKETKGLVNRLKRLPKQVDKNTISSLSKNPTKKQLAATAKEDAKRAKQFKKFIKKTARRLPGEYTIKSPTGDVTTSLAKGIRSAKTGGKSTVDVLKKTKPTKKVDDVLKTTTQKQPAKQTSQTVQEATDVLGSKGVNESQRRRLMKKLGEEGYVNLSGSIGRMVPGKAVKKAVNAQFPGRKWAKRGLWGLGTPAAIGGTSAGLDKLGDAIRYYGEDSGPIESPFGGSGSSARDLQLQEELDKSTQQNSLPRLAPTPPAGPPKPTPPPPKLDDATGLMQQSNEEDEFNLAYLAALERGERMSSQEFRAKWFNAQKKSRGISFGYA